MTCTVIVGGAFGDEGKGKIISYIALKENPEIGVRGGVGPNAGHTVIQNGKNLKLRMLPSAVVNEKTRLLIGAGVLVDPDVLLKEVFETKCDGRVAVDRNCAVIQEKNILEDKQGYLKDTIGTTGTGTGPANAERVMRVARLASDDPRLEGFTCNVSNELNASLDLGKNVLVEGTQGTLLSLYHGTYPFVTSKDVSASGICSDVGIGPKRVDEVIAVFKSYFTRVGSGPLEGELTADETLLRGWQEYGSVTGRLRRAAPFNFEAARYSIRLNSATQIALTKIDSMFPDTMRKRRYNDLPPEAKRFVSKVESELGKPVVYIGTGPSTEDIIDRKREG